MHVSEDYSLKISVAHDIAQSVSADAAAEWMKVVIR